MDATGLGPARVQELLIAAAMEKGFAVTAAGSARFLLSRLERPRWATLLGIALVPVLGVGLIVLRVRRHVSGEVSILQRDHRIAARFSRRLPASLVQCFGDALATERARPASGDGSAALTQGQSRTVLILGDGRRIALGRGLVIGRAPEPRRELPAARMLRVDDPSLSSTHASVGPTDDGAWVCDHTSTAGTRLALHGLTVHCQPEQRVPIPFGGTLRLGEVEIVVTRDVGRPDHRIDRSSTLPARPDQPRSGGLKFPPLEVRTR